MANSRTTNRRLAEQDRQFSRNNGGGNNRTNGRTIDSDVTHRTSLIRNLREMDRARSNRSGGSVSRDAAAAVARIRATNERRLAQRKGYDRASGGQARLGAAVAGHLQRNGGMQAVARSRIAAPAPPRPSGGGFGDVVGGIGAQAPAFDVEAEVQRQLAAMPNIEDYIKMLPNVDKGSYVGPYDAAGMLAHASAQKGTAAIQGGYNELRGNLQTGQADFDRQAALNKQALQAELQRVNGGVAAAIDPSIQALAAQGVAPDMIAQAQAQAAMGQGEAQAADARALQHQDRVAEVQQQSAQARTADAGLAEQAALANTQNNLGQVMGQIGMGRAKAEQAYTEDSSERARQEFQLRSEFANRQAEIRAATEQAAMEAAGSDQEQQWKLEDRAWELQKRELELAAQDSERQDRVRSEAVSARDRIRKANEARMKERRQAEGSPADRFWNDTYIGLTQSNPRAIQAFDAVVRAAGRSGAQSKARAIAMVRQQAETLRREGLKPDVIERWLREAYGEPQRRSR